jgi:hypothetical protein
LLIMKLASWNMFLMAAIFLNNVLDSNSSNNQPLRIATNHSKFGNGMVIMPVMKTEIGYKKEIG